MLEKILKMYVMYMLGDVRSPLPHLFGPPGCGKSTVVEMAAELLGVNLHIINVSRLSPLEVEGVQMPVDMETVERRLHMLIATYWSKLKEGDILLLDEFLRGFPEVYNALLDILTSRRVAGFVLPKVFIIGASNTTVAYDKALEDRLLHLPVADPRTNKGEKRRLQQILVDQIGLLPKMVDSMEMQALFDVEVLPMYKILDSLKQTNSSPIILEGRSLRNLIGQVQLREVQSTAMLEVLHMNNTYAKSEGKQQFLVLPDGNVDPATYDKLLKLGNSQSLTPQQSINIKINLQLIEMEAARKDGPEEVPSDDPFFDDLD
jgi:hypothetical protein